MPLFLSSLSLLIIILLSSTFVNICSTFIIAVLRSLPPHSIVCVIFGSVSIDISPGCGSIFLLICMPGNTVWMSEAVNVTLLGAGFYCIPLHTVALFPGMQLSYWESLDPLNFLSTFRSKLCFSRIAYSVGLL